ncbi:MAG TPA: sulfatase-like hydrolase/transferase [Thermoanaerobaculia bacterium]|nr:sulfatase-like hydrolase/transferase [Thermoanaerobaculia bacterium]
MFRKPNFVFVISDQQSGNPYWPEGWAEANLPAMRWLKERGIDFTRAYTNSCTCSPSRATLFTGLYPAQHGVTEVLEFDNIGPFVEDFNDPGQAQAVAMNVKERRQRGLAHNLQNLAKVLKSAGYNVIFKGKWHLSRPVNWVNDPANGIRQRYWTDADVKQIAELYGFDGWTMPDAGDNLAVPNMGGGEINNDQRFLTGHGHASRYGTSMPTERLVADSAIHFLKTYDESKPFCLVVSLVNPHDVLAYPGTVGGATGDQRTYRQAGYRDEEFADLPIDRPPTWNEDLSTKPRSQAEFRVLANAGNGVIDADDEEGQLGYCRFYAYLCRHVDRQILEVLHTLEASKHHGHTYVIRISDHGDMAMAHGLQRQKMFNMYEETLNIPFVIAHPEAVDCGRTSESLVSLVDLLPTVANLAAVPNADRWTFKGRDLSPILTNASAEVQDSIHFTYEDNYFFVPSANHMRVLVEKRWKYAVYYDIYTNQPFEYEMYDLDVPRDQREVVNLGHPGTEVSPEVAAERERLHKKLYRVMTTLGTIPDGVDWPERWNGQR